MERGALSHGCYFVILDMNMLAHTPHTVTLSGAVASRSGCGVKGSLLLSGLLGVCLQCDIQLAVGVVWALFAFFGRRGAAARSMTLDR